jgi:hypothetical protein
VTSVAVAGLPDEYPKGVETPYGSGGNQYPSWSGGFESLMLHVNPMRGR